MPHETPAAVAQQFCFVANGIHGLYLDVSMAVGNLAVTFEEYHKRYLDQLDASGAPQAPEARNPKLAYTRGPKGEQKPVHVTTIADLIERNRLHGKHMQFLARMCIVALYQYWDDEFRPRLAAALGKPTITITHDTFGELRQLRQSIIHHDGRALAKCASAKALPAFAPDSDILVDHGLMHQITEAVKKAARELGRTQGAA